MLKTTHPGFHRGVGTSCFDTSGQDRNSGHRGRIVHGAAFENTSFHTIHSGSLLPKTIAPLVSVGPDLTQHWASIS